MTCLYASFCRRCTHLALLVCAESKELVQLQGVALEVGSELVAEVIVAERGACVAYDLKPLGQIAARRQCMSALVSKAGVQYHNCNACVDLVVHEHVARDYGRVSVVLASMWEA